MTDCLVSVSLISNAFVMMNVTTRFLKKKTDFFQVASQSNILNLTKLKLLPLRLDVLVLLGGEKIFKNRIHDHIRRTLPHVINNVKINIK